MYTESYLSVRAYVLKQACNAAHILVEVVALFQGTGHGLIFQIRTLPTSLDARDKYLEALLVFLSMRFVQLLRLREIILQIATCMLISLKTLEK